MALVRSLYQDIGIESEKSVSREVGKQHEFATEAKSGRDADPALQSLKVLLDSCAHLIVRRDRFRFQWKKMLSHEHQTDSHISTSIFTMPTSRKTSRQRLPWLLLHEQRSFMGKLIFTLMP